MQRNSRLGCLTFPGVLSTVLTILAVVGITAARGGLFYNPGPLNAQAGEILGGVASHAETGGDCKACHSAPWDPTSMADLCVTCHGKIAQQMQGMVALHGSMYQNNPKLECRDCHPEHRGAGASLTVVQGEEFPHELLGYSLEGHEFRVRREPFTCADCHQEDITTFAPETCDTCHREIKAAFSLAHSLSFGSDCLACHDGVDRFGGRYDHDAVPFRLTGGHRDVECAFCHVDARILADFETAPQDCYACHHADDPHELRFGEVCDACHSTDSWQEFTFDHSLSAFQLEGKHAGVSCEACHQDNHFQGTPTDCYSCHRQDDEHNGRFGTDCAACHTPFNWEQATFDHDLSDFPLTGAHLEVNCEDCHRTGQFAGLSAQCAACHADPDFHLGEFSASCEECHSTTAWVPASFNLRHPRPRVDEEGSGANHGYTGCRTCHPASVQWYTCLACHSNNQGGGDGRGED